MQHFPMVRRKRFASRSPATAHSVMLIAGLTVARFAWSATWSAIPLAAKWCQCPASNPSPSNNQQRRTSWKTQKSITTAGHITQSIAMLARQADCTNSQMAKSENYSLVGHRPRHLGICGMARIFMSLCAQSSLSTHARTCGH